MKKLLNKLLLWIQVKVRSMMINMSLALYQTENELLKADPNITNEKDKRITRKRHRNQVLEKFFIGERDEKYTKDYYEILRRADKFMRTATPHKMAVAADKYGTNYGMKDQYGRRYEHYGFFDEKHKHAGKTLGEVLDAETEERRTKDDHYPLAYIFNNKPIEVGFANIMDVLEEQKDENAEFEYKVVDVFKKSKQFEFPIKVYRDTDEVVNKIEQLTEFLHVKRIAFEHRQLEFFIPLKFKTTGITENSDIFNEIVNIKDVFYRDTYGELIGFGVTKFIKKITYNDTHEVWKFEGIEMETVSLGKTQ